MENKYYSNGNKKVLDKKGRMRIAKQIVKLINSTVNKNTKVLDIGCSSGVISEYLAKQFGSVVGIDVDENALKIARRTKELNLKFLNMDATRMKFADNSFELIILNQVHYYFKNQKKLFSEIYRVLKPGGVVFLSGTNKYRVIKPFEPVPTYYKSFWELKKLFNKLEIHYQTKEVAGNKYSVLKLVPRLIFNILEPLSPNITWILEKKLD